MCIDFPGGSDGKVSVYNAGDLGSIPGSGKFPGEGNGNPLQYSCLENPMHRGAWCWLLSMGLQRVGHDWATSLCFFQLCIREYFKIISPLFSLYFELTLKKKNPALFITIPAFISIQLIIYYGFNFVPEVMVGILPLSLGLMQQKGILK